MRFSSNITEKFCSHFNGPKMLHHRWQYRFAYVNNYLMPEGHAIIDDDDDDDSPTTMHLYSHITDTLTSTTHTRSNPIKLRDATRQQIFTNTRVIWFVWGFSFTSG